MLKNKFIPIGRREGDILVKIGGGGIVEIPDRFPIQILPGKGIFIVEVLKFIGGRVKKQDFVLVPWEMARILAN